MGAYLYALQGPDTIRMVEYQGQQVALGIISFAYKPSPTGEQFNRTQDRKFVSPLRKLWRESGVPKPRFVTIGDVYTLVYAWPEKWMTCLDDVDFEGPNMRRVGTLVDNRRIEPTEV